MRPALLLAMLACVTATYAQQPKDGSSDPKVLAKLEKDFTTAEARLTKHPKDAAAKHDFVIKGTAYGHESMVSPLLPPRVKYRQALRIYRKVLKVDPKSPVAKNESDLIISIYKSMHRPIPE